MPRKRYSYHPACLLFPKLGKEEIHALAGISYDDAAVAFGCNPDTMRQHYIALDEVDISDRVMDRIQGRTGDGGNGHSPKGGNGQATDTSQPATPAGS